MESLSPSPPMAKLNPQVMGTEGRVEMHFGTLPLFKTPSNEDLCIHKKVIASQTKPIE